MGIFFIGFSIQERGTVYLNDLDNPTTLKLLVIIESRVSQESRFGFLLLLLLAWDESVVV